MKQKQKQMFNNRVHSVKIMSREASISKDQVGGSLKSLSPCQWLLFLMYSPICDINIVEAGKAE